MSRDKQIEEIVKDFCPLYQEHGSCKRCNNALDIDEEPCYYGCVANLIIDYGYRKSIDVAEEIFAEIESKLILNKAIHCGQKFYYTRLEDDIAELKKKYTKSEKGNDNT